MPATREHPATLRLKRVYEPAARGDGFRILTDRLWPRGLSKEKAKVDLWAKDVAPSTDLRKWFQPRRHPLARIRETLPRRTEE